MAEEPSVAPPPFEPPADGSRGAARLGEHGLAGMDADGAALLSAVTGAGGLAAAASRARKEPSSPIVLIEGAGNPTPPPPIPRQPDKGQRPSIRMALAASMLRHRRDPHEVAGETGVPLTLVELIAEGLHTHPATPTPPPAPHHLSPPTPTTDPATTPMTTTRPALIRPRRPWRGFPGGALAPWSGWPCSPTVA